MSAAHARKNLVTSGGIGDVARDESRRSSSAIRSIDGSPIVRIRIPCLPVKHRVSPERYVTGV